MADQSIIDKVEKLIQLATHEPTEGQKGGTPEEKAAFAMMAVRLIAKFSIPLGAEVRITRDAQWTPPSADFMETMGDILKGTKPADSPLDNKPGLMIRDNEVSTREEAFRAQMQRAWRAIREERRKIEAWVHKMRGELRQDYWTPDNPKPWE